MTPNEIFAEWVKGCSCVSPGRPWECSECTEAMAKAYSRQNRHSFSDVLGMVELVRIFFEDLKLTRRVDASRPKPHRGTRPDQNT